MPKPPETNKPSSGAQKRPRAFQATHEARDLSNLTMAPDAKLPFPPVNGKLRPQRDETLDTVFQGLLREANQELSSLFRDVRAESKATPVGEAGSQPLQELLKRALHCATKQYLLLTELGNLALKDELTGLYNRRGFLALADRQLKVARRSARSLLLFFIDVNGLKEINDVFGHAAGDAALKCASEALKTTFRDSDLITRLGGDEFAVLAIEASDQSEAAIRERLTHYFKTNRKDFPYELSLSLGTARFGPWSSLSIRELMAQADQAMYEQKRRRGAPRRVVAC